MVGGAFRVVIKVSPRSQQVKSKREALTRFWRFPNVGVILKTRPMQSDLCFSEMTWATACGIRGSRGRVGDLEEAVEVTSVTEQWACPGTEAAWL